MGPSGQRKIVIKGIAPPAAGKVIQVDADGQSVAVFNVGGNLLAIDSVCTHLGGPLDEGAVEEHRVECPWHGSVFDLETGRVLRGPAERPVRAYRAYMDTEGLVLEPRDLGSGVPAGH